MTSSSRAIDLLCRHRRGLGRRARPTRASTASSRTTRRARQLPHALERAARRERARARTPRPPRAWRTPTSSRSRARARGRRVRRAARRAVFPRGGLVSAFAGRRHERVFGEASTRKNGPRRRARALQRGPRPHRRGDRRVAAALRRGGERARDVRGRRRRVRGVGDEAEAPPAPSPPFSGTRPTSPSAAACRSTTVRTRSSGTVCDCRRRGAPASATAPASRDVLERFGDCELTDSDPWPGWAGDVAVAPRARRGLPGLIERPQQN